MTTKPVCVLLVEDDEVDVMNVRRAFKKLRIANLLVVVPDGLAALEALRREGEVPRPLIVLLDLNMPRMDGLEFLETIRDDPELKKLVVFVLTTSKADEDKLAAYAQNVAGYMIKSDVGSGFLDLVGMLDSYWRVVELPHE